MRKHIKLAVLILFIIGMTLSLLGCSGTKKQDNIAKDKKQTEQKKPKEEDKTKDEKKQEKTEEEKIAEAQKEDQKTETLFDISEIEGGYKIDSYKGDSDEVVIPSRYKTGKVVEIGARVFKDRKTLRKVTLNEGLKKIGIEAFKGTGIEKISMPSTLEEIDGEYVEYEDPYGAFAKCKNLKEVKLNDGLKKIGGSAFAESAIESVEIPKSVKTIGQVAFAQCSRLQTVALNEGLEEIGIWAFVQTDIKTIVIPQSVVKIGEASFFECEQLGTIKCKADAQPNGWHAKWNIKKSSDRHQVVWGYKD